MTESLDFIVIAVAVVAAAVGRNNGVIRWTPYTVIIRKTSFSSICILVGECLENIFVDPDAQLALLTAATRIFLADSAYAKKTLRAVVVAAAIALEELLAVAKKLVKSLAWRTCRRWLVNLSDILALQTALFRLAVIHVWRKERHVEPRTGLGYLQGGDPGLEIGEVGRSSNLRLEGRQVDVV